MTLAWKSDLPSGCKLVLLALCDNANDQGECYPSISMLTKKCSMSERSVFNHIADLESIGAVKRNVRPGRSTVYHLDPCKFCTPAKSAPLQPLHPTPAKSAPPPLQPLHPTPATVAPITIIEPSIEPSGNHHKRVKAAQPSSSLPDWMPVDAWNGYLEMRKKKRKEPTARAVELLIIELEKLKAAGQDIAAVLDKSTVNGWTDVYPLKAEANARASPQPQSTQLGKAGQATAAAAQRLIERMQSEQAN